MTADDSDVGNALGIRSDSRLALSLDRQSESSWGTCSRCEMGPLSAPTMESSSDASWPHSWAHPSAFCGVGRTPDFAVGSVVGVFVGALVGEFKGDVVRGIVGSSDQLLVSDREGSLVGAFPHTASIKTVVSTQEG